VLVTYAAMLVAIIITLAVLPLINKVSGQELSFASLARPGTVLILCIVPLLVGVTSGIYPALFMSGFNTVMVLKGVFHLNGKGISFRKVLVVSQFAISIVLLVATIVVFRQLDYMEHTSLGFNKSHVITADNFTSLNTSFTSFKNELLRDPSFAGVARSSLVPTDRLLNDLGS